LDFGVLLCLLDCAVETGVEDCRWISGLSDNQISSDFWGWRYLLEHGKHKQTNKWLGEQGAMCLGTLDCNRSALCLDLKGIDIQANFLSIYVPQDAVDRVHYE
jgi:hypothetical protein